MVAPAAGLAYLGVQQSRAERDRARQSFEAGNRKAAHFVAAALDDEARRTLDAIAQQTGGRFFRARDTAELAGIYAELDRLEPADQEGDTLRPRAELFPWPLALALLAALLPLLLVARARDATRASRAGSEAMRTT